MTSKGTKHVAEAYDTLAPRWEDDRPVNALFERPATLALLPPLAGLDILDAGCGTGWYSAHAMAEGARVVAFDASAGMVERARERLGQAVHHCDSAGILEVVGDRRFDLILSSLVLHYVEDLQQELRRYAQLLKPGGTVVISMNHPFKFAHSMGRYGYWTTQLMSLNWKGVEVRQFHRSLSAILTAVAGGGLNVRRIAEPRPPESLREADPEMYAFASKIPIILQLILTKPSDPAARPGG